MNKQQHGFFLIEAMVAVLIFALGVLGMVAMGGTAISAQSDARYRTMAAGLADDIAGTIALNVVRVTTVVNGVTRVDVDPLSVANFQHRPNVTSTCNFAGAPSAVAEVLAWATKAYTTGPLAVGLPGAFPTSQQIVVNNTATGFNRVEITVCWQAPTDTAMRQHKLVTYIN